MYFQMSESVMVILLKIKMEEEVGFEPTDPFEPTVFKTVVIDLSTTLP